jgi:hypothetical protein
MRLFRIIKRIPGDFQIEDGCFATSSSHWSYPKPWMVASQHPLRSCLTQSPGWLLRNILFAVALLKALDGCFATSSSHWSNPKPFKNICFADVFAFSCSSAKSSKLVSRLCTKKPALFVRAL